MNFLHIKIDKKISIDSLEYKSITDDKKSRSLKALMIDYINNDPVHMGGGK